MSKFIELTTLDKHKVLINIDSVVDVYCNSLGEGIITLGIREDGEYYYRFPNYDEVIKKIMEATN